MMMETAKTLKDISTLVTDYMALHPKRLKSFMYKITCILISMSSYTCYTNASNKHNIYLQQITQYTYAKRHPPMIQFWRLRYDNVRISHYTASVLEW